MGIQSCTELDRTYERDVLGGQVAKATRRWAVTLQDGDTPSGATQDEVLTQLQISTIGNTHPDAPVFKLHKVTVKELFDGSPYHLEATAEYTILQNEEDVTPLSRVAKWSFESSAAQVPALFYYDGSGNGTQYPLVNSANDYFQGLMADESMIKATVVQNFQNFPSSQMANTNSISDATYLGCPQHCWKVGGVNAVYTKELFGAAVISYWATTSTLLYRQSSWNLLIPDVGFNYLAGGQKRRGMVFDFENGEWVASPYPIGLDGSGNQTLGRPAILNRRVFPVASFQTLFGTPPS